MRINCSTAECYGLVGLFPNTNDLDEPVVLIVYLSHAVSAIEKQFGLSASTNSAKMENVRSFLQPGCTLHVPWIHPGADGSILYENGRHRTWGLAELGYQTVPVATMRRFAERLRPYWGSIKTAEQEYDFTKCEYPVIGDE